MKKIVCENINGIRATFKYSFPLFLENIDGIFEIQNTNTTSKSAFGIGSTYVGSSINERNIILSGAIKKDDFFEYRKLLYKVFQSGEKGTLYYYDDVERKIEYYVDNLQIIRGTVYYKFQISLLCPLPYFTDIDETVIYMANWENAFEFPLEIPNDGLVLAVRQDNPVCLIENNTNIEIGMKIIFKANDKVINPRIININTQEKMAINLVLNTGDELEVTTYRGNKNINYFPVNGEAININNRLIYGTNFLQIHIGNNTYKYESDSGSENLEVEIHYLNYYEAV